MEKIKDKKALIGVIIGVLVLCTLCACSLIAYWLSDDLTECWYDGFGGGYIEMQHGDVIEDETRVVECRYGKLDIVYKD